MTPQATEILGWTGLIFGMLVFPGILAYIGGAFDPILKLLGKKPMGLYYDDDPEKP